MRTGLTISSGAHAAALAFALWTFNANPFEPAPPESMGVDIVTATEFSKMTEGLQAAPKQEAPKPVVDKVAEKKAATELADKLTEKQQISPTKTEKTPPPPLPEPRKIEVKEKPVPQSEAKNEPQEKPDPIAEALKKDEAKKNEKKPEERKADSTPVPVPPKRPKIDPLKEVAALLDKRDPQRHEALGDVINRTASIGAPGASAPQLSSNELDALRARLRQNWNRLPGGEKITVTFAVKLSRDKRIVSIMATTSGQGHLFNAVRDSAARAILLSQPFDMLRNESYETWRDFEIEFSEEAMYGRR
jgi:colicin import membrane protein